MMKLQMLIHDDIANSGGAGVAQSVYRPGYGLEYQGSIPGRGNDGMFSPPRPDRLWGPPILLSGGYGVLLPGGKAIGSLSWPLTSVYGQG
jgi:hypothetical protein